MPKYLVPVTIVGTVEVKAKAVKDVMRHLNEMDIELIMAEMNVDDTTYGVPVKMKD